MATMRNAPTPLSPAERALRERFEATYATGQAPVMRAIERSVCGCDYGATSWTTREEADRIGALLALGPGVRLLDLGAGSGWPALYLAKTTGCDVTLTDLPATGLRIAMERALADREPGVRGASLRGAAVADGAALPFANATFDAISHSDVLCCLPRKREVLAACRHIIRDGGRMAFSILAVAPDLSPAAHARAVANGPDFIEAEADYPTLLRATGWSLLEQHDLTAAYAASCRRQQRADQEHATAVAALIGAKELSERQAGWISKLACLEEGLLRRAFYVATTGLL